MSARCAYFEQFSVNVNTDGGDDNNAQVPPARQGHASVLDSGANELFVFSGRVPADPGSGRRKYVHDFWKLEIPNKRWHRMPLDAACSPCARHSHSAVLFQKSILVFGGSNNDRYLGDLWSYDIVNERWQLLWPGDASESRAPSARHGHSATVWRHLMIVFGGKNGFNSTTYFNNCFAFDMLKKEWIDWPIANSAPIATRCWHSLTLIEPFDVAVLFGGFRLDESEGEVYYNDAWLLDLIKQKWLPVKAAGKRPHERNRHIALQLASPANRDECESMLIHSGNYFKSRDWWLDDAFLLEMRRSAEGEIAFEWKQLKMDKSGMSGDSPTARGQHTASLVENTRALFFGGEFERKRFNDVVSIRIKYV